MIPVSANLDHVGPMARTVRDVALLFSSIAGDEPGIGRELLSELERGVDGITIGVPRRQASERLDPEVRAAVDGALELLEQAGAHLRDVDLPDLARAETVMWVITSADAAEYHRPLLRNHASELHPLVAELLRRGETILATDYIHAQRVRQRLIDEQRDLFAHVDVVVLPTTAITAFPAGTDTVTIEGREEHVQPAMNRYTPLFDLTGGPALSLPCGLDSGGLPIGLQVAGPAFADTTVLRVARAYEHDARWTMLPPLEREPSAT